MTFSFKLNSEKENITHFRLHCLQLPKLMAPTKTRKTAHQGQRSNGESDSRQTAHSDDLSFHHHLGKLVVSFPDYSIKSTAELTCFGTSVFEARVDALTLLCLLQNREHPVSFKAMNQPSPFPIQLFPF